MKEFIINLFRRFPTCTGLLLILILFHLTGVKDFRTSWIWVPEAVLDVLIVYVVVIGSFMIFMLPLIDKEKREKITWCTIGISVVSVTIIANLITS